MGLRKYINNLEFSKKINYSRIGKGFENNDLARSTELCGIVMKECIMDKKISQKFLGAGMIPTFPIQALAIYGLMKYQKKELPGIYRLFSIDADLALNNSSQQSLRHKPYLHMWR